MFNWLRKKSNTSQHSLQDLLFGDAPIELWARKESAANTTEPIASFHRYRFSIERADAQSAEQALRNILSMPDLESRQYLQAWHFMRQLNLLPPPETERDLLGVVVEVGMKNGADTLAAYADHSARYLNFSGKVIAWDRPDNRLDPHIDTLLSSGREVLRSIGPWKEPRPLPPANGHARINFLTPIGLHFGEGPIALLAKDPRGGPVLSAATELMQQLIAIASNLQQS